MGLLPQLGLGLPAPRAAEPQTGRAIFLHAVGRAESASTEPSLPPVGLVVRPGVGGRPTTAADGPR